jgi:uncharacterized membrane protein
MLPVSELRGAIPFAMAKGLSPVSVFFLAVIPNILIIFLALFFLDYIHKYFMKISVYNKLFTMYLDRVRHKVALKNGMLPFLMLFLFVAIPFPGTGAYTGSMITWFFKMERKKAIPVMMLAVVSAGVLVTLASIGVFSLL